MAKRFIGGEIVSSVAPAGSVAAFAGSSAPDGWIFCQGQELSRTEYPELYAAIGDGWNTATNPTSGSAYAAPAAGNFRLPDFRGSFLRGAGSPHVGDTCSVSGHQSQKTAKNGLAVSGGTASGTFARNGHTHSRGSLVARVSLSSSKVIAYDSQSTSSYTADRKGLISSYSTSGESRSTGAVVAGNTAGNNTSASVSSTAASINNGDSETRPLNQGVNYIIKY